YTIPGPLDVAGPLAFHKDGLWLACADGDEVAIYDAARLTPQRRVQRDAASLVRFCFANDTPRSLVRERIAADATIGDAVRELALAMAEHYPERWEGDACAHRALVRLPGAPPDQYRSALAPFEAACRQAPQNGEYLTALGIVHYRLGNYQDALEWLTKA